MAIIGLLVASSPSFQHCIHDRKDHEAYKALHEESALLVKTIVRLKLHGACSRVAAGENDGAIVALATIILATFTYALWRATDRLWKSAENQLEAFERSLKHAEGAAAQQTSDMKASIDEASHAARAMQDVATAMQSQAKIAADTLKRSRRAWVGMYNSSEIPTYLEFDALGVHANIQVVLRNAGDSLSFGTFIADNLLVIRQSPFPPDDTGRVNAVEGKRFSRQGGMLILPSDQIIWPTIRAMAHRSDFWVDDQPSISVWWRGYIGYRDEFGSFHATRFLFRFYETGADRLQFGITPRGQVKGSFKSTGIGWDAT